MKYINLRLKELLLFMFGFLKKNESVVVSLLVVFLSPLFKTVLSVPWWITLLMVLLWLLIRKTWPKYSWLIFIILISLNLYINRLLSIKLNPLMISFDREQSFVDYPGIRVAIDRYKIEGLWLIYSLRNIFYSNYLLAFSWIGGLSKILSPILWVKMIGFSGFSLLLTGLISYLNDKKRKTYLGVWILLVTSTSALRVLGDSATFIYLSLPVIVCLIFMGAGNDLFKKYRFYWYLLFILDIILR